jgi:VIT1/CCC1 family predicted Fe2+/Mn2+ transporter
MARGEAEGVHIFAGSILSLLATILVFILFLMAVEEAIALGKGKDPASNAIRRVLRRYPRFSYVAAVIIGMLFGHLFWT